MLKISISEKNAVHLTFYYNPKKTTFVSTQKKAHQKLFSVFIILRAIINNWALNQHRMISEGSCDTEDWSNDAGIALPSQE